MKNYLLTAAAVLLSLTLLTGCFRPVTNPDQTPSEENPPSESGSDLNDEGNTSPDFTAEVYARQIDRYYSAISQKWDADAYFDNEMSSLASYYYQGNALDNIGFTLIDLNGDGIKELIIGAILNSEKDPLVFEIWTLKNDEPVMLAQSGSHNRYYLQYAEEDDMWSVAYEAENGAANHAVYYLHLVEGEFEVTQGVIFDALANENDPWFMTYDLDWNTSNDMPIDEETASDVIQAGREIYTAAEYQPYSQYK